MIVSDKRLYNEVIECNGLMMIMDPHVGSIKPGRRTDDAWPEAILRKLEACVEIANKRRLVPLISGDLLDQAVERDESLKTRLTRILKSFWMVSISNVGNHDIQNAVLSDGDTLALFATSDVLDVVARSGPVCEFAFGGKRFGLGMTPFGQRIPADVTGLFPAADSVIWMTHHDIAFENPYPGSTLPFEIAGCKLVINGHIHATKPPVSAGKTLWFNPGNINRQSIDLIDHVPCAWVLDATGGLVPIELPHQKAVFDLTGKLVTAADSKELVREIESAFVTLLKAESTTEMAMSADGSLLAEELEQRFKAENTPEAVQAVLRSLLAEAAQRRAA